MTDIEKAEKSEKEPLLSGRDGGSYTTEGDTVTSTHGTLQVTLKKNKHNDDETFCSVMCRCFRDRNPAFGANMELAIRGALFAMPIAAPFLMPGEGAIQFMHKYYSNTAIVIYVFTLYKTLGETICFAFAGMLGTFMAVLSIWCMFGLIPYGVTPEAPVWVHVFGWIWGLVFTFIVLLLNFDNNAKMFALSWHMYFWMTFLNPASHDFNHSWGMRLDGPAFKALTMSAVGCIVAVLAASIPYPLLAIQQARECSQQLAGVLRDSWSTVVECYAGEQRDLLKEDRLKHDLARLMKDVQLLSDHIDHAWWECFGFGRVQKARVSFGILQVKLRESYNRLGTLMHSCKMEKYDPRHTEMMKNLKKYLDSVCKEAGELFEMVTVATGDGHLAKAEIKSLSDQKSLAKRAVEELTQVFTKMQGDEINSDNLDEYSFCLNICAYGTLAIEYTETLIKNNEEKPKHVEGNAFFNLVDPATIMTSDHLHWVFRNGFSILISFVIGFFGYSAMMANYNSAPAETVSLLLSTFIGSGVNKNMGRIQGVVLGAVFGQLAYALFAWCYWWGFLIIGITVFVWLLLMLFVYYNSNEFGYIGCLMAAFGSKYMLQGCSNEVFQPTGTYYIIVNTVVGVTCMTVADIMLEPKRVSDLASKALSEAWEMYASAVEDLFNPAITTVRFTHGAILDKLTEASNLSEEARKEPRYYRTPWRYALFSHAVKASMILRMYLCVMECVIQDLSHRPDKSGYDKLIRLESFQKVKEDMINRITHIRDLLSVFSFEREGSPFEHLNLFAVSHEEEKMHLQELLKEVNETCSKDLKSCEDIQSLENAPECQLSTVVNTIEAQLKQMYHLKHKILSS
eukprot:gnl/MRDRNA2_/MRDRNA2_103230_c0_seq1.p1 gnl/MRDRNA2_/MRDRNA2_103230_c0~~gnl/MRDRNA2_/MRDRNA2_103230_c0_seq1.p1  ORF type:complete len:851 (-),score=141.24 gnl/MRDRNA2_/MRDRNA2_103230_c0_seq1:104-2656(-)